MVFRRSVKRPECMGVKDRVGWENAEALTVGIVVSFFLRRRNNSKNWNKK